jgi:hypothetical protein
MNRSILIALSLLFCLPVARAEHHEEEEEKTPLGEEMSAMNKAWRTIKKTAGDASQSEANLLLMDQVIQACMTSVDMVPIRSEDLPEEKRPEYIDAYQKEIRELNKRFEALKSAFEVGDNETAVRLIKKIDDFKKKEHKEFKPKDD